MHEYTNERTNERVKELQNDLAVENMCCYREMRLRMDALEKEEGGGRRGDERVQTLEELTAARDKGDGEDDEEKTDPRGGIVVLIDTVQATVGIERAAARATRLDEGRFTLWKTVGKGTLETHRAFTVVAQRSRGCQDASGRRRVARSGVLVLVLVPRLHLGLRLAPSDWQP